MKSPDGTAAKQTGKDEGPLTLERSKQWTRKSLAHVIDFSTATIQRKPASPSFGLVQPGRMHVTTVGLPDKVHGHGR
jgi:arylsulfatase